MKQATSVAVEVPGSVAGGVRNLGLWPAGALLLWLLSGMAERASDTAANLHGSAAWQIAGLACMLLSLLGCALGLWHAARRLDRRRWVGTGLAPKLATKLALAALGLAVAGGFAFRHLGEQAIELARIALGDDPLAVVQVQLDASGQALRLRGPLGAGSAERVLRALQRAPAVRLIRLDSAGGRVFEAQLIADEIRRRALDTYAEGLCASACTMLLLAGRGRGAADGARIGFHRPQFAGIDDEQVSDGHALLSAYRHAGLGPNFIAKVRATPGSSMWYPARSELQRQRVLTN